MKRSAMIGIIAIVCFLLGKASGGVQPASPAAARETSNWGGVNSKAPYSYALEGQKLAYDLDKKVLYP